MSIGNIINDAFLHWIAGTVLYILYMYVYERH